MLPKHLLKSKVCDFDTFMLWLQAEKDELIVKLEAHSDPNRYNYFGEVVNTYYGQIKIKPNFPAYISGEKVDCIKTESGLFIPSDSKAPFHSDMPVTAEFKGIGDQLERI